MNWLFVCGGVSLGMFVWLFTWGMNRVYLQFKKMVS